MDGERLTPASEEVLREWFADPERWWKKDPAFDRHLRERYGELVEEARRGELDAWAKTPRGALALVIVLDQFTRNIHRDSPRMYECDEKAVAICLAALERCDDASLSHDERQFLYMPLMHSETRSHQERSLEKFAELGRMDFARRHADIVFRFGRYPHRNAMLGRESTPEEIEFLEQPGASF